MEKESMHGSVLMMFLLCSLVLKLNAKPQGSFLIASPKIAATLVLDKKECRLVHTAAHIFTDDVARITGKQLQIVPESNNNYQIKVGTLGVNNDFDQECKKSGIDTDNLKSKWEAFSIKVVSDSKNCTLIIAGSSPRGTAYGLMQLSQMIGVSPWYWWADVRPEKKQAVELPGNLFLEDAPKVKFRGIFLNDEDWGLKPWASKTFEPETGDIGPKTYEKIFELLLRLKANAIWPAMHECTRAFFTYPENIEMANKYGIWVGSSHCEPMLRNNVDEWHRWNPSSGERGKWNFDENSAQLKEYWRQRIGTTARYDAIYTVGMRGIHDGDMPGGKDLNDKVRILNNVFEAQRNILHEGTGKDVTTIPQIFCPYKEVLNIYQAGAKVPEDVTIMWADDNYGYIRQLSNIEERKRVGGAGVYYHISYWGRPHDFLWMESIPVSLIWEEMHKAYQANARNVWIVNVGDIKGNEIGMNFFIEMAWNPESYSSEKLDQYYTQFAETQFGKKNSKEVGNILKQYFQLGFSRKPEHMGWNGVYPNTPIQDPELSLFSNGDEVQQRIDAYDKLEKQTEKLYEEMPDRLRDAFYQLVAYKVIGASNMNKKMLYAFKSRVYAQQERASANWYAEEAGKAFEKIIEATETYNNEISGGKWRYMMSYNPRQLPVFDMPKTSSFSPDKESEGKILPEGCSSFSNDKSKLYSLPAFNSATNRSYFIDIINSGKQPLKWEATGFKNWVKITKTSGQTASDERVWVSINWDLVTSGDTLCSTIQFKVGEKKYPVNIKAVKLNNWFSGRNTFIEDNGVVSIEAENYSGIQNTTKCKWQIIQGLGRQNDAVGSFPVTANPFEVDELKASPELTYNFITTTVGEVKLYFYCIPTLPINNDYQLRFAVSIDNADPLLVNAKLKGAIDENNPLWKNNVLCSVVIWDVNMSILERGKHVLRIKMIDPGVVIDKLELVFGERQGSYFGLPETIAR